MNEKQFETLIRVDTNVQTLLEQGIDHEERIQKLEISKAKQAGWLAALVVAASGVWQWWLNK